MQRVIRVIIAPVLMLCTLLAHGQGSLRGKIVSKNTGEELIAASVIINGTQLGAATDLDGSYIIDNIPAGMQTVVISYIGFETQTVTGVKIEDGKVTPLDVAISEVSATSNSGTLNEFVVEARKITSSEVSLLTLQKNSLAVQDGVSSQELSRVGTSNAAEGMKLITGASVEGGKYMVMRGLGDRYSLTQLNGVVLPSTDPYRNSSSLDLIPSSMLDNIVTAKTFTADQPGNFTGGNLNVTTKSFPDKFQFNVNLSGSYNTLSSFSNTFQQINPSKYGWLGFDDGTYALPDPLKNPDNIKAMTQGLAFTAQRNADKANILNTTSKSLSNVFVPIQGSSSLNHGLSMNIGNRHQLFGHRFGYILGVNYARSYQQYTDGVQASYEISDANATELNAQYVYKDNSSIDNPQMGGLFNMAYQLSSNHELSFNVLYNHDAEFMARSQEGFFPYALSNADENVFQTRALGYKQRQLLSTQLRGKHSFEKLHRLRMEWVGSRIVSEQNEPDLRFFANIYRPETNEYSIKQSEFDYPYHFFRYLTDKKYEGKLDFSLPLGTTASGNELKFGGYYSDKSRNFDEYRFRLSDQNSGGVSFYETRGDFSKYFSYDNIGVIDQKSEKSITGLYYVSESKPSNFYTGFERIGAGYAQLTYRLFPNLKSVIGARVENTDQYVKSEREADPPGIVKATDILPSLNLIYSLSEKSNLRAGASQTLARPNLRELAPFQSFDFIGGAFFVGNDTLKRSLIQNYDLRWELYMKPGEMIAASAYYKNFNDPIVRAFNPNSAYPEITFINVEKATVYGLELEFRKNLGSIDSALKNFRFSSNLSYIYSVVDVNSIELENSRKLNPEAKATRPFQGQSPYVANANLNYVALDGKMQGTVSFNIIGIRLSEVGYANRPDVYEKPRPLLNFNFSYQFSDHFKFGVNAVNLLDPAYEKIQNFKGQEYTVEKFRLGRTFGGSIGYFIF